MKLPASDWPARVQRIESLGFSTIIRGLWTGEATTFSGKHYQVQDAPRGIGVEEHGAPAILIGGGGRKLLTVAGRHADIVGINPSIPEGWITAKTSLDPTPVRLQEKIG
jgi:alkanesulfonate monooxygenase SsuD/methylene tetrahydromethanopterin reductase-like flavin-dependent oxidoreductase (luciferase family)